MDAALCSARVTATNSAHAAWSFGGVRFCCGTRAEVVRPFVQNGAGANDEITGGGPGQMTSAYVRTTSTHAVKDGTSP